MALLFRQQQSRNSKSHAFAVALRSWLFAMLLGPTVGLLGTSPAWAFCRTTTCKGTSCGTDADGCPTGGKKLFWSRRCVSFSMQQQGTRFLPMPAVRDAIRKAFGTWSTVICPNGQKVGLDLGELQDVPCGRSEYDSKGKNVNLVVFRDDAWEFKGIDDNVAKTNVHYDAETGEIHDVDMEINTSHNAFTVGDKNVQYDLQTVIIHEVGHFLGIAHSPDPMAVMYPEYQKGTTDGRKLGQDDIAAICALYPPRGLQGCDLTPEGGLDECLPQPDTMCTASVLPNGAPRPCPLPTAWQPLGVSVMLLLGLRLRRSA